MLAVQILRAAHGNAVRQARTSGEIQTVQGTAGDGCASECWETGTQVQELIAGIAAAVDYIAELGRHCDSTAKSRREALQAAYRATHQYETGLLTPLIAGLQAIPGMRIFGITDAKRFDERCSTLSFRLSDHAPTKIAAFLETAGFSPGTETSMRSTCPSVWEWNSTAASCGSG